MRRAQQQNTRQAIQADPQRLQTLRQQAGRGRLDRAQRRELQQLQRAERQQRLQGAPTVQRQQALRARQITRQQATQGRFAAGFGNADARNRFQRQAERGAAWRMSRLGAQAAWRHRHRARHVAWLGAVYWPYAYNDVFYYTFWPDAYEPAYWAYAYDDFFDGIFFPDGAPYADYVYDGPYEELPPALAASASAPSRSGRSARGASSARPSASTQQFCANQAQGITAWPFDRIAQAVRPDDRQQALLDELKKAANDGAAQFKEACPTDIPMTPPGRLQAMTQRLQATLDTVKIVRPPLTAFYESLSDEQKARFNEVGPSLGQRAAQAPDKGREGTDKGGAETADAQAACGGEKAGLSGLATEQIELAVQPNDQQYAALERLDDAMQKAVDDLQNACPNTTARTPVGRIEIMQKRLEAMIAAANAVRPALDDFYASLSDEQKATFNRLGRNTAQSGG
ncbi:MAG TPA: Spy/CpxP family protein refolding chaperone [Xanthobacteraceae bacterium]|nr:Spy/CpxP family protein refolding chaperone [Xanthobacteraceae bacterium]